jgi:tetratricopeptide (TPR) repeat protein
MYAQAREMIAASDTATRDELLAMLDLRSAILHFRLSRYDSATELLSAIADDSEPGYERALCLRYLGDYHFSHAGYCSARQSRQYLEECIELSARIDDIHLQAACLGELAILCANLDIDIEASQDYAAQAVDLARRTGRPDLLAASLDVLAWTTNHRGDYAAAESIWREVFEIAYRSGNRVNEALATNWLGWSAWSVGGERLAEAAQLFGDALLRYRNLGDRANQAMSCADLASVQLEMGEPDSAMQYCRRGLELAREIGRDDHYVYNLYVLGAVQCEQGDLAAARASLAQALELAWQQEEQTNKPAVLYYVARLIYAEHRAVADPDKLLLTLRLLRFLQCFPPTWQAFRDRAIQLQQRIEEECGMRLDAPWRDMPADELLQSMLPGVARLLDDVPA